MKEIRIHGRGGQGSVVLAELLAVAVFKDGKHPLAFPSLGGGERRGAPVQAFVRLDDKPVQIMEKVRCPDYVIIQDISLFDVADVLGGIKKNGIVIVNTSNREFQTGRPDLTVVPVDATKIAMDALGRPIVNTALLGAFAKVTKEVSMDAIKETICHKFDEDLIEGNLKAAYDAYHAVEL